MITSAGLVIIKDNKILLVHPTNAKWYGTYSIPKGHVVEGESLLDTAKRETAEEIEIRITPTYISPKAHLIEYKKDDGTVYKKVYYFIARLPKNYPIKDVLPKSNLQAAEVDWAGFIDKKVATTRIFPKLSGILKFLTI